MGGATPDGDGGGDGWTRQRVEARLIAAFRVLPSCPIYRFGSRVRTAAGAQRTPLTEVLEWGELLGDDPDARTALFGWARCNAQRASFGEFCRASGRARSTAEVARRRGADTLVARLNRSAPNSS